jgi:hypothetical protein
VSPRVGGRRATRGGPTGQVNAQRRPEQAQELSERTLLLHVRVEACPTGFSTKEAITEAALNRLEGSTQLHFCTVGRDSQFVGGARRTVQKFALQECFRPGNRGAGTHGQLTPAFRRTRLTLGERLGSVTQADAAALGPRCWSAGCASQVEQLSKVRHPRRAPCKQTKVRHPRASMRTHSQRQQWHH